MTLWMTLCRRNCWLCGHLQKELLNTRTWCRCSCWPGGHGVGVVSNSADTASEWSTTMRTRCGRSQRLCGHRQDYTDTFRKVSRFLQIGKEQSGENRYLCVFTNPIAIIKKYENVRIYVRKICDWISSQKRKSSWNRFGLFIWGPGRIFKEK